MDTSKIQKYFPAILTAIVAIAGIIYASTQFDGSDQSFDNLSVGVSGLGLSANEAVGIAKNSKDTNACIAFTSVGAVVGGVYDSITAAKSGACRLPDVKVDVTDCLLLSVGKVEPVPATVSDTEPPVATEPIVVPVSVGGEIVPVPTPTEPAASTPVSNVVDSAFQPVFSFLKATASNSKLPPKTKAWSQATLTWVESSHESVVALVANPGSGKFVLHGVDVDPDSCSIKVAPAVEPFTAPVPVEPAVQTPPESLYTPDPASVPVAVPAKDPAPVI